MTQKKLWITLLAFLMLGIAGLDPNEMRGYSASINVSTILFLLPSIFQSLMDKPTHKTMFFTGQF